MAQSEHIDALATALCRFQSEIETVKRDSTAKIPTKSGSEYSYNYADLEACIRAAQPVLSKHELAVTQTGGLAISGGELVPTLETMLMHSSGQWKSGEQLLLLKSSDPQGQGSAITYARRYGYCAILGLVSGDDDDGAAAMQSHREQSERPARPAMPACPQCGMLNLKESRYKPGEWYCWEKSNPPGCGYKGSAPDTLEEAGNYDTQDFPKEAGSAVGATATATPQNAPTVAKQVGDEEWDKLKALAEKNKWPHAFVKQQLEARKREFKGDMRKVYEWGWEHYNQPNANYVDETTTNELLKEAEEIGF